MKGSQMIFPGGLQDVATNNTRPMREFRRRVRLALEEHHLLPGDPNRIFNTFTAEDRDPACGGRQARARGIIQSPKTTTNHGSYNSEAAGDKSLERGIIEINRPFLALRRHASRQR